jgi:Uma2 family endonuclease
MAIATERLTYEQYITEPEIRSRYDIIDGVRIFMTNPTIGHQKVLGNVYLGIRAWQQVSRSAEVIQAPCDVLIRRDPLRTRQPDVLVISHERLGGRDLDDPSPLNPAPELVVEILSPSNTQRAQDELLADYAMVGVLECWVVNRTLRTVEVLRFTDQGAEPASVYGMGENIQSLTFPDLTLAVASVFAL